MRIRDPKPEIQRLESLVKEIRFGEVRLPKFQRPFVWNKVDMLNLLDSIYNGYPIGSILLWNSSERLKSERTIFDFDVNDVSPETYPTDYLLDGQQRLTTLCGALYWKGTDPKSIWNIHFDLETEKFIHPTRQDSIRLFPLNKLMSTSDFIRQCMKFEHHPQSKVYYENAEKLLESIKNYKIAVVKIGDIPLDEIAPIFERINSTGRKLTMVDLMRAATWKGQFDLSETIEAINDTAVEIGFGKISETGILRSLAAAAGFGINKADIDKLRTLGASELTIAGESVRLSLAKAMMFLREEILMPNATYMPYGVQLTHLGEFFRICAVPSDISLSKLGQWFWITSVARYFAGANTGQNSKDLALMQSFARGEIDNLFSEEFVIDLSGLAFDDFNLRTASSITFSLLQVRENPRFSITGEQIERTAVGNIDRDDFFDVLPKGDIHQNSNIGQIYNPDRKKKKTMHTENFVPNSSLFINQQAIDRLIGNDSSEFVYERIELIKEKLKELTGRRVDVVYE
jgi:hypothetical protein